MRRRPVGLIVFCAGLAIPLIAQTPAAPLPEQILAAKKVFVAYAGNDVRDYLTGGDRDRPYKDFYAALKAWGRYDLVGAPSGADLLFEIRLTIHPGQWIGGGFSPTDVQLRLAIRDPKTRTPLWTLTEHVQPSPSQVKRNKNFGLAMAKLVSDVQLLTPPPAAPAGASK